MMMTREHGDIAKAPFKWRKLITSVLIGGVAGFLAASGFMQLVDSEALGRLNASREIAGLVGILYLMTGAFVGIGAINPGVGARFLNVEDADELREQRKVLGLSALGMIAFGAVLVILALAAPIGPIPPGFALAGVIALMVFSSITGARQTRLTDELMKAVSRESTSLAFYLLFLFGGGWAALAHLGYAAGPAMLDWITMFAALMLISAFWVCGRRGMLMPR
ncbi:MAG: hypothetical protein WBA55_07565 [Allopontixanthobacter sediminis]